MKQLKSLLPAALLTLCAGLPGVSSAADLTISCGAVGAELQLCKEAVEAWSKQTGNNVEVVSTPNSATERLSFYQQILSAQSSDIDIIQIDMVWPGMLAKHLMDLREVLAPDATQGYFQAQIDNATVNGRLVTMPWFTDSGLLYYRKDWLEKYNKPVPQTWEEMTATAKEVQQAERNAGNPNVWGYIFQGARLRRSDVQCTGVDQQPTGRRTGHPARRHRGQQPGFKSGFDPGEKLGSATSPRVAYSITPRKKDVVSSSRATRCSCVTGLMSGPWCKARTVPSKTRWASLPCPAAAAPAAMRPPLVGGVWRFRVTAPIRSLPQSW